MQVRQINASCLPELGEILRARYHIEELMSKLQADWVRELPPDQARQERLRIWNQIKLEVVSKTVSAIYVTSLLSLLVAAQLAIVGKYLYIKDVLDRARMPPLPIRTDLEQTAAVGKALMAICTRFVASGAETIDAAVSRATALVLSRVEVHQPVSRNDLDRCVTSIRHEIEDAAGRDIIEEVLLGHDALSDAFGGLPTSLRPFANTLFANLKEALTSPLFKHQLGSLVDRKTSSIIGLACEELYTSSPEPLLLSIIPNVNAEFWILMSPKMMVEADPHVTTLMASVFRSVNIQL
jgi:hypothetical protein